MFIKQLTLKNIGPFVGEVSINIETTPTKNITLIGGKNGAGKTTILKSIRIALFGSYAFGLKTETAGYYVSLSEMFNYKVAKLPNPEYSMSIEFILDEEFSQNLYTIKRSWVKKDEIVETHSVYVNGRQLHLVEEENFFMKLKEIYPPTLIDAFLFDGEKVGQIIEKQALSEYVKDLFYSNFGVNYFEKLVDDLVQYKNFEVDSTEKTVDEIELEDHEKEFRTLTKDRDDLSNELQKRNLYRISLLMKLKELQVRLNNYGGISFEEKNRIQRELRSEKSRIESIRKLFQTFFEDDLFFYIHRDLLDSSIKQIELEKPIRYSQYIDEIQSFIKSDALEKIKSEIDAIKSTNNVSVYQNADIYTAKKLLKKQESLKKISAKDFLVNYYQHLEEEKSSFVQNKLLENMKNNPELIDLVNEIDDVQLDLNKTIADIEQINERKASIETAIDLTRQQIELLETKIRRESNEENSYTVALKIVSTVEKFKQKFIRRKLDEVSSLLITNLDKVFTKDNYFTSVIIDDGFNIKIKDKEGEEMPIYILSAGEKQLIVATLIYTLVKLSNRNLMFVFDTPLARLDKSNRVNLVSSIMKDVSRQTIILSTNTEIVDDLKDIINEKINQQYCLNYIDSEGFSVISEGYFEE